MEHVHLPGLLRLTLNVKRTTEHGGDRWRFLDDGYACILTLTGFLF